MTEEQSTTNIVNDAAGGDEGTTDVVDIASMAETMLDVLGAAPG